MISRNKHVLDLVDGYVHGALDAGDAELVRAHSAECRICHVALEEAHKRLASLDLLGTVEAPQSPIHATQERIAENRQGGL
jgi:hypothetical protein